MFFKFTDSHNVEYSTNSNGLSCGIFLKNGSTIDKADGIIKDLLMLMTLKPMLETCRNRKHLMNLIVNILILF